MVPSHDNSEAELPTKKSQFLHRLSVLVSQEKPEEPIWYGVLIKGSLSVVVLVYLFYALNVFIGFPVTTSTSILLVVLLATVLAVHNLRTKREIPKVTLSVSTILEFCLVVGIISIPAAIFSLELSRHSLLPGGDPAFYIWQSRFIETRNSVLIPWGPFPDFSKMYYPPFFGILLSFSNALTGVDFFSCTRVILLLLVFLGGLLYYAFAKIALPKSRYVPLLVLFFMMANMGLVIRITVDGSYSETMLCLFLYPLLINTLQSRRVVSSGLVLASLLGTHGFSLIVGPSMFVAFILESVLAMDSKRFTGVLLTLVVFVLFAIPFLPLYQQYFVVIQTGQAAIFPSMPLYWYPTMIGSLLFYGGFVSGAFLLLFAGNCRFVGLLLFSQIVITRLAGGVTDEGRLIALLAPVFSLAFALTCVTVILYTRKLRSSPAPSQRRKRLSGVIEVGVLILVLSEPAAIGIPQLMQLSTLPSVYENPAKEDAYVWLSKHTALTDKVIALQFSDPYAIAFVNCYVYSIVSPELSYTLSDEDRRINNDLAFALLRADMTLLDKYGITFIVVSTPPDTSVGSWPVGEPEFLLSVYNSSLSYGAISYVAESNAEVTTVFKVG